MKSLVWNAFKTSGVVLLVSAWVYAHEPVLIDFGHTNHPVASPDQNGRYWNHLGTSSSQPPSGTLTNLLDETGALTGIRLVIAGFGAGANTNGTTVPDATALGSLAVSNATRDSFFVQSPSTTGTLTFSGLVVGATYRMDFFGSRDAADTRRTRYTASGLITTSAVLQTSGSGIGAPPETNANRSGLATLMQVQPNAQGVITLTVSTEEGTFGYLGAMRLIRTGMPSTNSPPVVQFPTLTGPPVVGRRLNVHYAYWDAENDAEGDTFIEWVAGAPPFTNAGIPLASGTNEWFEISPSLTGWYVRAVITPLAQSGAVTGIPAQTAWKGPIVSSNALAVFHIGNSFTRWGHIPEQLRRLATNAGHIHVHGFQLADGMGLGYHWTNGILGGQFTTGTPARLELGSEGWDWLVLQPMSREWTAENKPAFLDFAQRFASLAQSNNTRVALYQYWNYLDESNSVQDQIAAVFEEVRHSLASNGIETVIIPSGQAFTAAVARIPGLDRADLYRDNIHPSDIGYYLSALVHFSVLYTRAPTGLTNWAISSDPDSDDPVAIPSGLATALQAVAWDIARATPSTTVTRRRFARWAESLPAGARGVLDDPYTNGLPNLLRWVYGISPSAADDPSRHLFAAVSNSNAIITFGRGADAEDAGVSLQSWWSTNLLLWSAGWPSGFSVSTQEQRYVIQAPPEGFNDRIYFRLRAVLP